MGQGCTFRSTEVAHLPWATGWSLPSTNTSRLCLRGWKTLYRSAPRAVQSHGTSTHAPEALGPPGSHLLDPYQSGPPPAFELSRNRVVRCNLVPGFLTGEAGCFLSAENHLQPLSCALRPPPGLNGATGPVLTAGQAGGRDNPTSGSDRTCRWFS